MGADHRPCGVSGGSASTTNSFGGLIAQKLAGEGASAATVAIDPAPFRGVLPLPVSSLNPGLTEIVELPDRGRSVVVDHGWAEVAETALAFVKDDGQRSETI